MNPPQSATIAPASTAGAPTGTTLSCDHFDQLYAAGEDPWHVETSWYEQRKHR